MKICVFVIHWFAVCSCVLGVHLVPLYGTPNTGYCARVTFGISQQFCVLVDSASSNFAVAATPGLQVDRYFHTELADASFTQLPQSTSVTYTGGSWSGTLAKANVSISGSHIVTAYFALITSANKFFTPGLLWQGILGLGFASLAQHQKSSAKSVAIALEEPGKYVEPLFDSLLHASADWEDIFTLQLCPSSLYQTNSTPSGTMVLGGVSEALFSGAVYYTPITEDKFYSVLLTNMTVGNVSINLPCSEFNNDRTVVDSGTVDIYLPPKPFTALTLTLSKHFDDHSVPKRFWNGGAKLAWPSSDSLKIFKAFPIIYFGLAVDGQPDLEFSLAIPPQIYLRRVSGTASEQLETNCLPECDFFVFGVKQRERGSVIGANAMLAYTTVFDRAQMRIGFASSTCDYSDNSLLPHITGPYVREPEDCKCSGCGPGLAYWQVTVYVCSSVVIPLTVVLVVCALCSRFRHRKAGHFNILTDHENSAEQTSNHIMTDSSVETVT